MTLVGKILTVLIFIMSISFMVCAVFVFATHKNWREFATNTDQTGGKKLGLQQQLDQAKARETQLNTEIQKLKNRLAEEQAARAGALAGIMTKYATALSELQAKQTELATLIANHTEVAKASQLAQTRLESLEKETAVLRDDLRVTEADLDKKFEMVVKLNDDLNQFQGQSLRLGETNQQLALQVTRMKMVMDANGLTEFTLVSTIPPRLNGKVNEINGRDLIEISIGFDDGIRPGHVVQIYRGNTYIGQAIVKQTSPDRAVAQLVRDMMKGTIQRGDNVTTKLG